MHHIDDIMMIKALMKSHEIHHIEFAPLPEANVVALCDKFEIRAISPFYHMNVVAVNNKFERRQVVKCMNKGFERHN